MALTMNDIYEILKKDGGRTTSVSTELPSIKSPEQRKQNYVTIKSFMFKMPYLCRFENFSNRCVFLEGREFGVISPPSLPKQITLVCFPRVIYFVSFLFG